MLLLLPQHFDPLFFIGMLNGQVQHLVFDHKFGKHFIHCLRVGLCNFGFVIYRLSGSLRVPPLHNIRFTDQLSLPEIHRFLFFSRYYRKLLRWPFQNWIYLLLLFTLLDVMVTLTHFLFQRIHVELVRILIIWSFHLDRIRPLQGVRMVLTS